MFCYEKLASQPTERVNYTDADMQAYVDKHSEMAIADNRLKLKDVFAQRLSGGMANLEEGVLKHWSGGRIVLAGDACHKYTPNAGLGLNNGIQDVVVLVNKLHELLAGSDTDAFPTQEELTSLFEDYQETRKEVVHSDFDFSRHNTRLHAWPNSTYWLMNRYIMPNIPFLNKILVEKVGNTKTSKSFVLDFVDSEELFQGKRPWVRPMKSGLTTKVAA